MIFLYVLDGISSQVVLMMRVLQAQAFSQEVIMVEAS